MPPTSATPPQSPGHLSVAIGLAAAATTLLLETAIGWFLLGRRVRDVVMLYLLGVVIMAMRFGYAASLFTAAVSVAAVDFFFTAPYFSLAVADKQYVMTFVIFLLVAFVISNLTEKIRRSAADAHHREIRTGKLYAMSRGLASSGSVEEIVDVAMRHVREAFASGVAVLLPKEGSGLRVAEPLSERTLQLDATVQARADELFAQSLASTSAGQALATGERLLPLWIGPRALGVLIVRPSTRGGDALDSDDPFASPTNRELLEAFANQIALAMDRSRLVQETQRVQLEIQRERLRNALLSSVSHDLRTPLAVVKGAVTALIDQQENLPPGRLREYLRTISDEASRLNRLVRNLLNMTSIEAGALRARKEWHVLEEVVGVALGRLDEQLADRLVEVRIDPNASLVALDATLIEQVLVNLIENALKYTPPSSPIEILASATDEGVDVEVADRGPGVPPGQEAIVFEKFYRATENRAVGGMGLGLTICRGIVIAHGGRIWCENRSNGGASFHFFLPRSKETPAPQMLPEAAEL